MKQVKSSLISQKAFEAFQVETRQEAKNLMVCLAIDQFCFDLWKAIFRNRYGDILK